MWVTFWVALLLITQAIPESPAVAPTTAASAPGSDLERLVGTWRCDGSTPGNSSVETYERGSDGGLVLQNDVRGSSGTVGTVVETFSYDAANETWTVTSPANAFFDGLTLSGSRWTGATWTLAGSELARDTPHDIRIAYTQLGPDAFRREHQTSVAGAWRDDASYTCHRTSQIATTPALPSAKTATPEPATPTAATTQPATPAPAIPERATAHPQARIVPASPRPTPSPKPTPTPRPTPTPTPLDRARTLAGGRWICRTLAGNRDTHVYRTVADGAIALVNRITIGGHAYEIDERYWYDRLRRVWTNDTAGGAYRGTASPWSARDWTFAGVATDRGTAQNVRMIYRTLGADAFRRDFERAGAAGWVTYASETCER